MPESESPVISSKTLSHLTSKNNALRKAATEEVEKLGDKKFEALLIAISQETVKRRKTQKALMGFATFMGIVMGLIVLAGIAKGYATGKWDIFSNWGSFFSMFAITGSSASLSKSYQNAVRLLADFDDLRAVGPLLETRESEDANLKQLAQQSLLRLLPRLKSSDANLLDEVQLQCMGRALKSKDFVFVCAILKAMEQVGDEKHLELVQRLSKKETTNPIQLRIREAAQECEPYLRKRVEETQLANTLLRASQMEDAPAILLRPVEYRPDTATHELLRPESAPESRTTPYNVTEPQQTEANVQQISSS